MESNGISTLDRLNALVAQCKRDCESKGFREGSGDFYAAFSGMLQAKLLSEMCGHDFWKAEALKMIG